ncbi:MAG: terminase family protein [Phenylobacterium sp.]|nr:terminase family protein [Phenylobacterium sp.]
MDTPPLDIKPPAFDPRREAKWLYWTGWRLVDIAERFGLPLPTVASWKGRDGWDSAKPIDRVEGVLEARIIQLVTKDHHTGNDFKAIDNLTRQMERLARIRRYGEPGGHEGDLNPKVSERGRKARAARPPANFFTAEQVEELGRRFRERNFAHQELWLANKGLRTREILKSRQTGATFYFAGEALDDGLNGGGNQIFLSASKNQARVFRTYMIQLAQEVGVDLKGDPFIFPPMNGHEGFEIYFLGTNARTAQGYHGNFYFDEFFWTFKFRELNKLARAMATHKHWRRTYFSTPSSKSHEAYQMWSGGEFNRGRRKDEKIQLDLSHGALGGGRLCEDGAWRHILTIHDAVAGGMDLFDVNELMLENNPADFSNLYLCEFVDDTLSVFPLALLSPCMVDAWEAWTDVDWLAIDMGGRPFGNLPVWIGYDPSATGDTAALLVVAPPRRPGGKFRILEKQQFRGLDFDKQAAAIRQICARYNVERISIDANGVGLAVLQLVRAFFPAAEAVGYTPADKQRMVLKAYDVIKSQRLEFDAGEVTIAQALMAIRKTLTASGRQITYEAGRTDETGHADLAWALLHTLINEPLEEPHGGAARSMVEVY